jgi:hypothetical protein
LWSLAAVRHGLVRMPQALILCRCVACLDDVVKVSPAHATRLHIRVVWRAADRCSRTGPHFGAPSDAYYYRTSCARVRACCAALGTALSATPSSVTRLVVGQSVVHLLASPAGPLPTPLSPLPPPKGSTPTAIKLLAQLQGTVGPQSENIQHAVSDRGDIAAHGGQPGDCCSRANFSSATSRSLR